MTERRFLPAAIVWSLACCLLIQFGGQGIAHAHDTWVQVSSNLIRPDDAVRVDLFLGNHGNDHRDFKIAGKLGSLDGATLAVRGPDGRTTDLVPELVDVGYAPKEGWWSGRFVADSVGLHCVSHVREGIRHGSRGLKGGKAYFLVSESLDDPAAATDSFATPLGHPLELVLDTHPVLGCGPGREIAVRLLMQGKPVADERVSFIPRGTTLKEGFDPDFERKTDSQGRCRWTPKQGDLVLVVAHVVRPDETGADYDKTTYAATLVLDIPQRCSCCD
jgi:uncharacterized GH25 family protein